MKIDREAHPNVLVRESEWDGKVHAFGAMFGSTWCADDIDADEDAEHEPRGGTPEGDPADFDWCEVCKAAAIEEGLLVE